MLILRWLLATLLRGKEVASLLVISIFCIWLAKRPPEFQQQWRSALASSVFFPVQSVLDAVRVRTALKSELDSVRAENARIVAENARLSQSLLEIGRMGAMDSMVPSLPAPVVPARVVARNPLRLGGLWILDAGNDKGIQEGMAAMTSKGVVGRIVSSAHGHSTLQAIADPDCKIAAISTRSNNPGIVYSPDGARILIEYAVTSDIKLGDSLVTWGAGGTFPRGLPVGRVAEIIKSPANLMKSARIVPFQNPWMVEDVFVLLRPPILKVGGDLPPDSIEVDTTRVEKK